METRLLRIGEVTARCGLSKSAIYARMAEGAFPRPVKLGRRAVAWDSGQIASWIAARIQAARQPAQPPHEARA